MGARPTNPTGACPRLNQQNVGPDPKKLTVGPALFIRLDAQAKADGFGPDYYGRMLIEYALNRREAGEIAVCSPSAETSPAPTPPRNHSTPPPPDLANLAYLEDMRSRLGELAQIARAAVPATAPAATLAAHMRMIDHADAVHDYLVRLSLTERGLI